jgi:hypothetical protein
MTPCQEGKIMLIVDNFRGKNLDLTKCQGTRWNGDNPLAPYWDHSFVPFSPTFPHPFLYHDSIMTTLFPLTISGRPFFYYMCFPDKKGGVSTRRGETTLGVFKRYVIPLQRGNRYLIRPLVR